MLSGKFCDHTKTPDYLNTACSEFASSPVKGIITAEECAQSCQDDPTCMLFEYNPGKACYIYEECNQFFSFNFVDSHITYCYEDAAEQGEHFLSFYLHS